MCTAGMDSVSLRREVLRHVKRLVPADACFFNTLDPETGLVTHGLGENAPPELMRQFFGHVYPGGEAERIIDLARSGEIVDRDPSDEMRRLFATMGFGRELRAAFSVREEPWGLWCAVREHGSRAFDDRERALMRRIARPVGRALRTAALREVARTASAGDDAAPGVLVVDGRGTVLQQTPVASAQLADLADVGRDPAELPSVLSGVLARQRVAPTTTHEAPPAGQLRARGRSRVTTGVDGRVPIHPVVLIASSARRGPRWA